MPAPMPAPKDSGRYKVANCTQAQPVFYGFAGLPDGKVILVSVLRVRMLTRIMREGVDLGETQGPPCGTNVVYTNV